MPDSHIKFHSANGKRRILIVEDEAINRAILGNVLEERYELLYAADGAQALELIRENRDTLSLVLLDLILPDIHGLDILRRLRAEDALTRLPVIVMTADREAEVESLTIGAIDFIPKPYPAPKVILARVLRTIELSEDRDIIHHTERDHLTGLYNREFFYRYAEQLDMYHKEQPMDAVVVDINHFHLINERHGRHHGDEVLRSVGEQLRRQVADEGGIVCRRESNTFLIYCPHRTDYSAILDNASVSLNGGEGGINTRVRLRMGVYADADKSIDVERRFDRAKMAADTVRNAFTKAVAMYDDTLHESEIFEEQLLEDFPAAIAQRQFFVCFQPRFDIRPTKPVLASAEALVRWRHPTLGMVSPGVFIPLFEKNGLIQELDSYVWRKAAAQLRDWKTRLGVSVPISVNVSRVDMFDPGLVDDLTDLVREYGLEAGEIGLEITESAYTQDSEQIIETVKKLRGAGFTVEMDDFGTGYSSLNMISTLPIDALKLDMEFVRNAFRERKDTRLLEVVIDIADSLSVPTITEGVETAEQMFALKAMGCDIVQGYYFSKPVPASEFEAFLWERDREPGRAAAAAVGRLAEKSRAHERLAYDALHDPETGLYNNSAFEILLKDADQEHIAVLVADVDDFDALKGQGRESTAKALRNAASVLRSSFRSVDFVCRLREDEFVVIMTRVTDSMRKLVLEKIERLNDTLRCPGEGVPPVTLSVGIAFSDRASPKGDIFRDADAALFTIKESNRRGCAVY